GGASPRTGRHPHRSSPEGATQPTTKSAAPPGLSREDRPIEGEESPALLHSACLSSPLLLRISPSPFLPPQNRSAMRSNNCFPSRAEEQFTSPVATGPPRLPAGMRDSGRNSSSFP